MIGLSACANGSGLRVEGADAPPTSATPSAGPSVMGTTEGNRTPEVAVDLQQVRRKLLADKNLPTYSRGVLANCTVISRCLSRGKTVDVMHSGTPQQIVLIHTLDNFVFGFFLIAVEPSGPRPIWSLKVDLPTVNASPQGDLVVESKIFTIEDKTCCPSGSRVEVYRWNGRQMTKVSSADQKGD
ncbi:MULTISPECIES: hypothetical protein [unclassified Kribbella]|uniref:hypothetical protein n=1 Tax=unclassified Kribbella TaxID=2644121 RepID=UPI00301AA4BB